MIFRQDMLNYLAKVSLFSQSLINKLKNLFKLSQNWFPELLHCITVVRLTR